jgi:hypothetical protein
MCNIYPFFKRETSSILLIHLPCFLLHSGSPLTTNLDHVNTRWGLERTGFPNSSYMFLGNWFHFDAGASLHVSQPASSHASEFKSHAKREAQSSFKFEMNVIKCLRLVSHGSRAFVQALDRSALMLDRLRSRSRMLD